jgi:squalene synthase HpnC
MDAVTARARTENFRVASVLLPRQSRSELMDLYRFARFVDEVGDSYPGDRTSALEWLESELRRGLDGVTATHPAVAGVAGLARRKIITAAPLFDLIQANRVDQEVHRYETLDDLLSYCELSANPVGLMVLQLFGVSTPERIAWSNSICTGLQLVEHWQDVAEDARCGRMYLPAEDLRSFGVDPTELRGRRGVSPAYQAMMAFETRRARDFLDAGRPLIQSINGRLRIAIAGFWAGGHAALDALERAEFDPSSYRTHRSPMRVGWHLCRALMTKPRHDQK